LAAESLLVSRLLEARRVREDPSPPSDALVDSLVSPEGLLGRVNRTAFDAVSQTREQTRAFDGR
jgi:hypothetical protein